VEPFRLFHPTHSYADFAETVKDTVFLVLVHQFRYNQTMQRYKVFNHTADLGIEVTGRTKGELFTKAALSLMDIVVEKKGTGASLKEKALTVEGSDPADLLINFLREILYLFNGEALIIGKCEITKCSNKTLDARLLLEPYNKKKHVMKTEIKAVTYHGLSIKRTKTEWVARVIFDV
jgi:SHS2 domain-containing protein